MHLVIEQFMTSLAFGLCPVHCRIGVTKYFLRLFISGAAECNADAGSCPDLVAFKLERLADLLLDTFCNTRCLAGLGNVFKQHCEFIPAKSRYHILRSNTNAKALSHVNQ